VGAVGDIDEADDGTEFVADAAGVSGGAVLGWPALGLSEVQAVSSRVARQAESRAVGLLRVVTGVTSP
jgi:hypothetical protein